MLKYILLLIAISIVGCATKTPMPVPCEVKVRGECREMTAGERSGAVVRGHGEEAKEIK